LDLLPDLYALEEESLDKFNADKDLLTLKMQLKEENRNMTQLNSSEIAMLEILAEGEVGMARTSARNILEAFYAYDNFCDCVDRNINKRSASFNYKDESESPLKIEATPNPATHYVEFYYELSEIDKDGVISISDINGKIIQIFNIKHIKGIQAWDTRNIPAGSYIYTLKTKYFEQSDKLIIQ